MAPQFSGDDGGDGSGLMYWFESHCSRVGADCVVGDAAGGSIASSPEGGVVAGRPMDVDGCCQYQTDEEESVLLLPEGSTLNYFCESAQVCRFLCLFLRVNEI